MLVYVIFMWMVQVAVVEVIDVVMMLDRGVSTVWAMLVGMVGVYFTSHFKLPEGVQRNCLNGFIM